MKTKEYFLESVEIKRDWERIARQENTGKYPIWEKIKVVTTNDETGEKFTNYFTELMWFTNKKDLKEFLLKFSNIVKYTYDD